MDVKCNLDENHSIEDALKDTIARVFSRSSQIPIKIGNNYTYI